MKGSVVISAGNPTSKLNKTGCRGNAGQLADYLEREKNIEVECIEVSGTAATTPRDALLEMEDVAKGTQCDRHLYHYQINPAVGVELSREEALKLADRTEKALGLEGHPRVVYRHVGEDGREHYHVAVSRIYQDKHGKLRAVNMGNDAEKRQKVADAWEKERGLDGLKRPLIDRWPRGKARVAKVPDRDYRIAARLHEKHPKEIKTELTAIREKSKSGQEFVKAVKDAGYVVANGTTADFLAVDQKGRGHNLAKYSGTTAKELKSFMADVDRSKLPDLAQAQEMQKQRHEGLGQEPRETAREIRARLKAEHENSPHGERLRNFKRQIWDDQKAKQKERYARNRATLKAKTSAIKAARMNPAARKAALSIARMEKVLADQMAKQSAETERGNITSMTAQATRESFIGYLTEKAQGGDEHALSELQFRKKMDERRALQRDESTLELRSAEPRRDGPQPAPFYRGMQFRQERNGDVIYSHNGKTILEDRGDRVWIKQNDSASIEAGLRLAVQKFGKTLILEGTKDFNEKAARVVAEANLNVEFTDKRLNQIVVERKAEIITERKAAQEAATIYAKSQAPENTKDGRYTGTVQLTTDKHVFLANERGKITRIERSKITGDVPKVGEKIRAEYQNGTVKVQRNLEQQQAIKHEKGKGIGD